MSVSDRVRLPGLSILPLRAFPVYTISGNSENRLSSLSPSHPESSAFRPRDGSAPKGTGRLRSLGPLTPEKGLARRYSAQQRRHSANVTSLAAHP